MSSFKGKSSFKEHDFRLFVLTVAMSDGDKLDGNDIVDWILLMCDDERYRVLIGMKRCERRLGMPRWDAEFQDLVGNGVGKLFATTVLAGSMV